jgi:hypothetical protein
MKFNGQRDFHKWHLEGKRVKVSYLDSPLVEGVVQSSRICYGGTVNHWVKLDQPLRFSWDAPDLEPREYVSILEHWDEAENELFEILD